jgi:hypothetical protein
MSDHDDDDKSVGYGRPPEHSQFKPGQSGNPKGRPPKSKNKKRILKEMLFETVTVTLGQRRTRLTCLEVMTRAAVNKAVQGDARAYRNVQRWIDNCGLEQEEQPATATPRPKPKPSAMHLRYQELFKEALAKIEAAEEAGDS